MLGPSYSGRSAGREAGWANRRDLSGFTLLPASSSVGSGPVVLSQRVRRDKEGEAVSKGERSYVLRCFRCGTPRTLILFVLLFLIFSNGSLSFKSPWNKQNRRPRSWRLSEQRVLLCSCLATHKLLLNLIQCIRDIGKPIVRNSAMWRVCTSFKQIHSR